MPFPLLSLIPTVIKALTGGGGTPKVEVPKPHEALAQYEAPKLPESTSKKS